MSWNYDSYTAPDGRRFSIFSEQIRGERRYYWGREHTPGRGNVRDGGIGSRDWTEIDGASGFDKRTVKRRIERYVGETDA